MEGWNRTGIGGFLQQMKAVLFSNGVNLSLIYHLLVETILFLAYPPPFVPVMVSTLLYLESTSEPSCLFLS